MKVDFSTFWGKISALHRVEIYTLSVQTVYLVSHPDTQFLHFPIVFKPIQSSAYLKFYSPNSASESNFRHAELKIGLNSHCEVHIVSLCFEANERNWIALEMDGMIIVMFGTCHVVAMQWLSSLSVGFRRHSLTHCCA